ncbi:MAG: hypothetical protein A2Y76_03580 [Planctomycetes bacterium RBG_13_60_9]|nr:MAG: hypothetical protein A2Y76_03580 [Planctomycetes bacterium RBG_13_60_9]
MGVGGSAAKESFLADIFVDIGSVNVVTSARLPVVLLFVVRVMREALDWFGRPPQILRAIAGDGTWVNVPVCRSSLR